MKSRSLWEVVIILSITLVILGVYSFSEKEFTIFDVGLQKSDIKKSLYPVKPDSLNLEVNNVGIIFPDDRKKVEIDSSSQRILLIGDSMLEGLLHRLRDYCDFNKHDFNTVIWYSSSTKWFGTTDTLDYFLKKLKPTYVFIVVGSNELFIADIANKRDQYVKNIVSKLGNTNFVWIGPPNWKKDTGINDMILSNIGSKRFFLSRELKLARNADGAHPTREAAGAWMDSVCCWVMNKSMHPILLNLPNSVGKSSPKVTILQPL